MFWIIILTGILIFVAWVIRAVLAKKMKKEERKKKLGLPESKPRGKVAKEKEFKLPKPEPWVGTVAFFSYFLVCVIALVYACAPFWFCQTGWWWQWALWLVVGIVIVCFLREWFAQIQEKQRLVTTVCGAFWKIEGPGPKFLVPWVMSGNIISTQEHFIELFLPKKNDEGKESRNELDLKGGGTVTLPGALWGIKILDDIDPNANDTTSDIEEKKEKEIRKNVYRAVYETQNYQVAIRAKAETAINTLFRNLEIKDFFGDGQKKNVGKDWKEDIAGKVDEKSDVEKAINGYGLETTRIIFPNFVWSPEVLKKRQAVYESAQEEIIQGNLANAARKKAKADAEKIVGIYLQTLNRLKEEQPKLTEEEAVSKTDQLVEFYLDREIGTVVEWKGGNFSGAIAEVQNILKVGSTITKTQ